MAFLNGFAEFCYSIVARFSSFWRLGATEYRKYVIIQKGRTKKVKKKGTGGGTSSSKKNKKKTKTTPSSSVEDHKDQSLYDEL